jgi:hypothetical protein
VIAPDLVALDVHPEHWLRLLRSLDALARGLGRPLPGRESFARALAAAAPRLALDEDPAAQWLALVNPWSGRVFRALQLAFDRLWPDGTSLVLMVVDEDLDELWTSLIARKARGDVDLLTTDRRLGSDGLQPVGWRADAPRLLELVARRVAPPHAGLFCTRAALEGWLASPDRLAALDRLRASGEVLLAPWPWRLAGALFVLRALARLGVRLPGG